ncbi:MAG: dihydroneopterin aldolase [Sphingobacteriaceae bacterium]
MGKILQQVALKDVRFYAFHGFYPEEQQIGSVFYVDLITELEISGNLNDDLAQTVNYERLFEIADLEMKQTRKLIETVAKSILDAVLMTFPKLQTVQVIIRKMNPPLAGEVGHSEVVLNWSK